jgi:hypothetical protein
MKQANGAAFSEPDLVIHGLLDVLLSDDPRERARMVANHVVGHLMVIARAKAAAVLAVSHGRAQAFLSRGPSDGKEAAGSAGMDLASLSALSFLWSRYHEQLRSGEHAEDENGRFHLYPIFDDDGGALVAVLCLEGAEKTVAIEVAAFSASLAKAVQKAKSTPQRSTADYLSSVSSEDLEKERLLLLLDRNEWNIARVARLMGVVRRTIYLRLERYNITREHVRKQGLRKRDLRPNPSET